MNKSCNESWISNWVEYRYIELKDHAIAGTGVGGLSDSVSTSPRAGGSSTKNSLSDNEFLVDDEFRSRAHFVVLSTALYASGWLCSRWRRKLVVLPQYAISWLHNVQTAIFAFNFLNNIHTHDRGILSIEGKKMIAKNDKSPDTHIGTWQWHIIAGTIL